MPGCCTAETSSNAVMIVSVVTMLTCSTEGGLYRLILARTDELPLISPRLTIG